MNRQLLRRGVAALVVLDLLAVLAFSVREPHTTTTRTLHAAIVALPSAIAGASVPAATPTPTPTSSPVAITPVVDRAVISTPDSSSPAPTGTATTPAPTVTSSGSSTPTPAPTDAAVADCPIPLATPAQSGGLQSLISFSPAFGPFSAEAFAAASAYQPLLQLIGPILAKFPQMTAGFSAAFTPFVTAVGNLMNVVFTLIQPYYAPYRRKVLKTETTLAGFLAPYAEKLADSPLGGCVVDLEAALVSDTSPVKSTVKSTVQGR